MRESTLRKLTLLLLVGVIISLLWAIGSTSRKKVELKKSETLERKLNKLILANTASANDLKATRNRLSELQRSKRLLKKSLTIETEKNEAMEKKIEKATSSALGKSKSIDDLANDAKILKDTNITLGEEILALKEKDAALKSEIEKLKAQLTQPEKNTPSKKKTKRSRRKINNSNKNFNWQ